MLFQNTCLYKQKQNWVIILLAKRCGSDRITCKNLE